jgi:hypothetical protein
MNESEMLESILEYFRQNAQVADAPSFSEFGYPKGLCLRHFQQEAQLENLDRDKTKAYEMNVEHMLGYKEMREEAMQRAQQLAKSCAEQLFGFDASRIGIERLDLMVNGSTLPLRAEVRIDGEGQITHRMYIKEFDLSRLAGLEVYSLTAGIKTDQYNFMVGRDIILEEAIEGKHAFEITEDLTADQQYRRSRVKLDLIAGYTGLDDFVKADNSIITPIRDIAIIDFDLMGREYSQRDLELMAQATCDELGMRKEEYKAIYETEQILLKERVFTARRRIRTFAGLLEKTEDDALAIMGSLITKNTKSLLEEK